MSRAASESVHTPACPRGKRQTLAEENGMRILQTVRLFTSPGRGTQGLRRRAVAAVLAGALIAVAGPSIAYAVPSQPAERLSVSDVVTLAGPYYLINNNGKYLAPSGNLLIVSSSGGTSRYFNTVPDSGYVTFEHDATGLNVNTINNSTANGARAALSPGSGSFTQDWSVLPYRGALFRLQNRAAASRCLGISGGSTGTNVAIFNCAIASNQLWRLQSIV